MRAGVPSFMLGKLGLMRAAHPTRVQVEAIQYLCANLAGPAGDCVIHSETGSGKTLAYLIPIFARIEPKVAPHAKLRAVIITPTRELSHQVATVAASLGEVGKHKDASKTVRVRRVVGEVTAEVMHELKNDPPHILIGTPKTLATIIPAHVNMGELQFVVLDEADELVRNHSVGAVRAILGATTKCRGDPAHVAVSATSSFGLQKFTAEFLDKQARVVDLLGGHMGTPASLAHLFVRVPRPAAAYNTFNRVLAALRPTAVLSFHNTAKTMEALEVHLKSKAIRVKVIGNAYGNATRARALEAVSTGTAQVLLSTEMAARGLDLPRLSHVINFDPAKSLREYVHRVGRVARLSSTTPGRVGTAVSFVMDDREEGELVDMASELGVALSELTIVEGEPVVTQLLGPVSDLAAWRKGAPMRARGRDRAAAAASVEGSVEHDGGAALSVMGVMHTGSRPGQHAAPAAALVPALVPPDLQTLDRYCGVPLPPGVLCVEYIWVTRQSTAFVPGQAMRSKTRVLHLAGGAVPTRAEELPAWDADGLSVSQGDAWTWGQPASVGRLPYTVLMTLRPVRACTDPFRGPPHLLALCECVFEDGSAPASNHRARARAALAFADKREPSADPWWAFEQEYTLFADQERTVPLGFDPALQSAFLNYCGVGADAVGRKVQEAHMMLCLAAGLHVSGTNLEVLVGSCEYQIGPCSGMDAADELFLSRWVLARVGEEAGVYVSFNPKPLPDQDGAGLHTNFSTAAMRRSPGGWYAIVLAMGKFASRHRHHLAAYGPGNERRLTGGEEYSTLNDFTWGVGDRGASVRVAFAASPHRDGAGYFEDRRPGANADPYLILLQFCITLWGPWQDRARGKGGRLPSMQPLSRTDVGLAHRRLTSEDVQHEGRLEAAAAAAAVRHGRRAVRGGAPPPPPGEGSGEGGRHDEPRPPRPTSRRLVRTPWTSRRALSLVARMPPQVTVEGGGGSLSGGESGEDGGSSSDGSVGEEGEEEDGDWEGADGEDDGTVSTPASRAASEPADVHRAAAAATATGAATAEGQSDGEEGARLSPPPSSPAPARRERRARARRSAPHVPPGGRAARHQVQLPWVGIPVPPLPPLQVRGRSTPASTGEELFRQAALDRQC